MNVDDAALATRKYWSAPHWEYQDTYFAAHDGYDPENIGELYGSCAEAQAACDRMNLRAVLDAIRGFGGPFAPDYEMVIDAIIEEVGK